MASYIRLPERVLQAEAIAVDHGGTLPRPTLLKEINPQLAQAVFRHPEAFAHIPRGYIGHRTPEEWVRFAEEIAVKNGGLLPKHKDMVQEYPSLASCMYRLPQIFEHIPRAKWTLAKKARIGDYVQQAEALASQNGGVLHLSRALKTDNNALTCAMRSNPEAFAHIPRFHRETKSLAEHVEFARELTQKFDGKLPPVSLLKRSYPALRTMMQKHPEAFAEFSKLTLTTTLAQYVEQARNLLDTNGGVLPAGSWMNKHGYKNLESAIYRKPKAFAGMQQELLDARGNRTGLKTL
jgi:hypothetical protein